jgi:hypothetical protein
VEEKMEDDAKCRFDDFDKRFQTLEKRFDDVKWYLGGAAAMFAVFISLFTLIANSNLSGERSELSQFKNDLRSDLGKAESIPDIQLLGLDGEPLSGQDLSAKVESGKDGYRQLVISYIMRNAGNGHSGLMFLKVYANDPIHLDSHSTDEKGFKYEDFISPTSFSPSDLPGGNYTTTYVMHVHVDRDIPIGKYPVLFNVYFGNGKVVQTRFEISI